MKEKLLRIIKKRLQFVAIHTVTNFVVYNNVFLSIFNNSPYYLKMLSFYTALYFIIYHIEFVYT
jgi:hypothetical protein